MFGDVAGQFGKSPSKQSFSIVVIIFPGNLVRYCLEKSRVLMHNPRHFSPGAQPLSRSKMTHWKGKMVPELLELQDQSTWRAVRADASCQSARKSPVSGRLSHLTTARSKAACQ